MRICKAIAQFYQHRKGIIKRQTCPRVQDRFFCESCRYESKRRFNVERHMERIHLKTKLRVCCGRSFYTKGDYYVHCEELHPETRAHAITSRTKYKITSDLIPIDHRESNERDSDSRLEEVSMNTVRLTRYKRQVNMNVRMEYSISCNEQDLENIPLISFLTDHRLKPYLKRFSPTKFANESNDEPKKKKEEEKVETTNRTVKIAISSGRNVEETTVSTNNAGSVRTKVSSSSVSSFSLELPAKKLILHRFRESVHEFETPLRERSDNDLNRLNRVEWRTNETISRSCHNRTKYSELGTNKNRMDENDPTYAWSLKQQLNVNLDTAISVPIVTRQHRDFLEPIDFEQYKIF